MCKTGTHDSTPFPGGGGYSHNELIEGTNWLWSISCLKHIGKSEKYLELYLQQMGKSQTSGAVHKIYGNCLVEVQYKTTNHFVANECKPGLRCHHLQEETQLGSWVVGIHSCEFAPLLTSKEASFRVRVSVTVLGSTRQ